MSIMGLKRRRPTLASAAVVAATLLTAAGANIDDGRSSLQPTSELQFDAGDDHSAEPLHELSGGHRANDHDVHAHRHSESFRRRLAQTSAEAFANVTERFARAVPLDLKIDDSDPASPVGYLAGLSGHLEEYSEAFARIGNGEDVNGAYFDSVLQLDDVVEGDHVPPQHKGRPERLYYKILAADGIRPGVNPSLRGRAEDRSLHEVSSAIRLDSIEFKATAEEEGDEALSDHGRSLQSYASQFANSASLMQPVNNRQNRKRNKQKNKHNGRNRDNKKNRDQTGNKKKLPRMDQLAPSKGSVVQKTQTFSARVLPSQGTGAAIDKVTFQLTDRHEGQKSGWLDVQAGNHGMYELAIDGFEKYETSRWSYEFQALDDDGRSASSGNIRFKVAGNSGGGNDNDNNNDRNNESIEKAPPQSQLMPKTKVKDSDWSHGGDIQQSVGRIMFEFDGTDQTFVCSGTVVCDGNGGRADTRNGRSIVVTAAHCAYNDQLNRFATRALFIPDQANTKADKSNMKCSDDPMGCWHMSFAVVAKGWTEGGGFPYNVGFDYAYWVVHDDRDTHERGYKSGLTGILDRDVPCFNVDYDSRRRNDEFVYSLGYSADKDPDFRHCSMEAGTINGIPTYTNLWLDDCAMSGGASGGPWMKDLDMNGRGTVMSVNSWGFTHKDGMAGPVFQTEEGSLAECLFEKAQRADDPGRQGGIVVNNC
ncbi:hypothetical protein ACHAXT_007938 [Thalassiosira profunda]